MTHKRQTAEMLNDGGSSRPLSDGPAEQRTTEALAYQLWLQRGCPIGSDQEDWYEAERQLGHLRSALLHEAA